MQATRTNVLTALTVVAGMAGLAALTFFVLGEAQERQERLRIAQAHLARGIELFHRKDYVHAQAELRTTLRANPDEWSAPFYVGAIQIEERKYGIAIPYLERALVLKPSEPKILNALGVAYFKLGRLDMAKGYFTASIDLDPTNVGAKGLLETMAKVQRRAENAPAEAKDQAHVRPKHH